MVHGIQQGVTEQHLRALFPGDSGRPQEDSGRPQEAMVAEERSSEAGGVEKDCVVGTSKKKKKKAADMSLKQGAEESPVPAFECMEGMLSDKKVLLVFKCVCAIIYN